MPDPIPLSAFQDGEPALRRIVAEFEKIKRPSADEVAELEHAARALGYSEGWILDTLASKGP